MTVKTLMREWAVAALTGALLFAPVAWAGPGHDHGDEPAVAHEGPKRLPDGGVFLPKPAQRQLAVRTIVANQETLAPSYELNGLVLMDPNAGGKVQPTQTGRLDMGPQGLPSLGQKVTKGEVLGYVVPAVSSLDRANQEAITAELRASRDLAHKRLARLKALEGTVPRKDIEEAASEVNSLSARLKATSTALTTREALIAPVTGVISTANVVAGQVVDPNETLFEIVVPERLLIEALSYDPAASQDIGAATLSTGAGRNAPLVFIGAGAQLKEQALPLLFRLAEGADVSLAVGQPVKVLVQSSEQVQAIPIPRAAVVKNPSNQDIVWVHDHAEQFVPRIVRYAPLDGSRVAVTDGIRAGERIVVQGAPLINQVR